MYADLHMHSTFSDGTDTPAELFRLAKGMDIQVIAIADHDSIRGVRYAAHGLCRLGQRRVRDIER